MRKRIFLGDHPSVANSLNNLAKLYYGKKEYKEAEHLYLKALKMFERTLGVEHPFTITVQNNLRDLQQKLTLSSIWKQKIKSFFDWMTDN